MTTRTAWLAIAAFVALTLWLLAGAVLTVTHQARVWVPATAPGSEPVIYTSEETP